MKDDHLDSKSGWDHSKRKGKEKATESSFRVETMGTPWGDKVHGGGSCDGSCQPGPACSLFPRRPDGKVILPDPRDISRQVVRAESYHGKSRRARPVVDLRPHSYHGIGLEESAQKEFDSGPSTSRSLTVENYAQLSSLPGFRAFRMDQADGNGATHTQLPPTNKASDKANVSTSESSRQITSDAEWQQWKMREIRVVRRKRKQEYIRSGTHDFSIRLWANHEA